MNVNNVDIAELPSAEKQTGKTAVLYINPVTKELFYEYEDNELTENEKALKDELNTLKKDLVPLYPEWSAGTAYAVNVVVRHQDKLYRVVQAHTSQADWAPDKTPALFVLTYSEGTTPEWVQPTGAHDAYNKGAKVLFEGKVYESLIDANVWSPTAYPAGWKEVV